LVDYSYSDIIKYWVYERHVGGTTMKIIFNIIQGLKSLIVTPSVTVALSSLKTATVILPIFSTVFISSHMPTTDSGLITELESILTSEHYNSQIDSTDASLSNYFKDSGLISYPSRSIATFSSSTSSKAYFIPSVNSSAKFSSSANIKRVEAPRVSDKVSTKSKPSPVIENQSVRENQIYYKDVSAVNGLHGAVNQVEVTHTNKVSEENKTSKLNAKHEPQPNYHSSNSSSSEDELTFNNIVAAGLGSNSLNDVFVDDYGIIYAASTNGLSISYDGGLSFLNKNESDGMGDANVTSVFVDIYNNIYACNKFGLSISVDAGDSFINIDDSVGLGDKEVNDVWVDMAGIIYVATKKGLSISNDNGVSFVNKDEADGLGDKEVNGIYVHDGVIYAATKKGLSWSYDGGSSFINKDSQDGLADNMTTQVFVDDLDTIYVATSKGLSISADHGLSFTNKTEIDGLGDQKVNGVYVYNNVIYVATDKGLTISLNGGESFKNYNEAQGLGDKRTQSVFVNLQQKIFVATRNGLSILGN